MSRHYHSLLNVLTSAAFSYAKNSYHQDEADPTPTITGSPGGTFSATPSGLSINASTGTIDLENSTIQAYTITYTVSGVSSNFSLSVTASPFIANNFSMEFDSASSQYIDAGSSIGIIGTETRTFSVWLKTSTTSTQTVLGTRDVNTNGWVIQIELNSILFFNVLGGANKGIYTTAANLTDNNWYHLAIVRAGSSNNKIYVNGVPQTLNTSTFGAENLSNPQSSKNMLIGAGYNTGGTLYRFFDGNMDEVAIWNAALGETAIQEIYDATANNTGKALDLSTDYNNYTSSSNLQYWNRLGD